MGDMQLGPVSSYITLLPDYNFTEALTLTEREDIRTKSGALFTYIKGSHRKFNIPETWVSSLSRSLVNSWWETGQDLRFIPNNDFVSSFHTVRIMGDEEPYQSFIQPYFNTYWAGEIVLETV